MSVSQKVELIQRTKHELMVNIDNNIVHRKEFWEQRTPVISNYFANYNVSVEREAKDKSIG